MKNFLCQRKKGTSLIEMIIVIGILSIMSLVISRFLVNGFKTYRTTTQGIDSEEKAARVMRDFEYSVRAATDIAIAAENEFAFFRYYDLVSPSPKKIRYFMDGSTFKVGITEPVGSLPNVTYPDGEEKIDYLIENVTNLSMRFFDDSGDEISGLPNVSSIRMVGLSITVDQDSNLPPAPMTQTTKVNLRNLKKNL